jgi:hypothetical protein
MSVLRYEPKAWASARHADQYAFELGIITARMRITGN